jgi:RNA polymerase sigma-70 factor (ECF subfamily)
MSAGDISSARTGDESAFRELVEPYRRQLHLHCYRLLGSLQDAEDIVQETLLAAWRGLSGFEERASLRTWLYRIATNRCLNALRDRRRQPQEESSMAEPPRPTWLAEQMWLDPYPDAMLEGLADSAPGPEASYETGEALGLAFTDGLQRLPPRQRTALVLREVLGFRTAEVAEMLETSEATVRSAQRRAGAARARLPVVIARPRCLARCASVNSSTASPPWSRGIH